tara:strand:- start:2 stop:334 length:333 start_codon:yes stop_codon:yes gene_type:complete
MDIDKYAKIIPYEDTDPEAVLRILDLRKTVMEKVFEMEMEAGLILRHESTMEKCKAQMAGEGIESWALKDLQGRVRIARASKARAQERIKILEMEVEAHLKLLVDKKDQG